MISKKIYEMTTAVVKAHFGLGPDQLAVLIQRHLQDEPVLGHLVLGDMLEYGQLEIVRDGDYFRIATVAPAPAE